MIDAGDALQPQDFGIGRLFWRIREAVIVGDAATGQIVLWNPAAEALFGYPAAEVLGCPIEILVPEHLRARHRAGLARFLATGHGDLMDADVGLELPALHRNGQALTIELLLSPIDEAPADRHFVLAVVRDATARKRAEEQRLALAREQAARAAAEAAQHRLTLLAEVSQLLVSSLEWETTLANIARLVVPRLADWCVIDFLDEDGTIRPVEVAAHAPGAVPLLRELVARNRRGPGWAHHPTSAALRTGHPQLVADVPDANLAAIADDAEHLALILRYRPRSVIAVPLTSRGRTLGALTFLATDERPRYAASDVPLAEELGRRAASAIDNALLFKQARDAIAVRDEFISVAAHELKTPITGLRGYAQLLVRRLDRGRHVDAASLRATLEQVNRQAEKLTRLVSQLLDVSRIEAGKLQLEIESIDVARLVRDAVAAARARSAEHTVALHGPDELWAEIDPLRLEQVLVNLLDNAVKYSPDGGPIDVELSEHDPETVRLVVADRGLGIPPEYHTRVFDRFYQAHAAHHMSGMGLGLYVSREIVTLHGGVIQAETRPGGGTRFVITMPRRHHSYSPG